jgi:hypothetical protein
MLISEQSVERQGFVEGQDSTISSWQSYPEHFTTDLPSDVKKQIKTEQEAK